jgi:hypothetical protein
MAAFLPIRVELMQIAHFTAASLFSQYADVLLHMLCQELR